jgi:hypothetical protein
VVPSEVKTYPLEPIPSLVALFVPFPIIRSPVVVMGDKALNAADAEVCPVPPLDMPNVPARVIAPVEAVAGVKPLKEVVNDVTPPVEAAQVGKPPASVNTNPFVPTDSLLNVFVAEAYKISPALYVD